LRWIKDKTIRPEMTRWSGMRTDCVRPALSKKREDHMRHGSGFLAGAALAAWSAFPAAAQEPVGANTPWMGDWGWGHMAYGGWMMVVFWGGIILAVVLLARAFGSGRSGPGRVSALDILQERFARGEIDKAEYEEKRRTISE
jgi:putative membrane protein